MDQAEGYTVYKEVVHIAKTTPIDRLDAWADAKENGRHEEAHGILTFTGGIHTMRIKEADLYWMIKRHKMEVEDALTQGENVPRDVLADYPGLSLPSECNGQAMSKPKDTA
jgi:hypothetical protein